VTDGLDQPAAPESLQDRSARTRARSVRQDEGVDAFQAFQRVLYRSAKQDPERRFHALYDKLSRRDVMYYSPRRICALCENVGAEKQLQAASLR